MNQGPSSAELALRFALLSLVAVGGANTVLPEMHRQVVDVNHWLSSAEFAALYAIAQAAPGPNVLVVSLIGWKVSGLGGALICTIAMCGPSSVLAFGVGRVWDHFRASPWRRAIERGLAPITIGLVLGSGWLLVQAAGEGWPTYALAAAGAALSLWSRRSPLWWLAIGAAAGALLGM